MPNDKSKSSPSLPGRGILEGSALESLLRSDDLGAVLEVVVQAAKDVGEQHRLHELWGELLPVIVEHIDEQGERIKRLEELVNELL